MAAAAATRVQPTLPDYRATCAAPHAQNTRDVHVHGAAGTEMECTPTLPQDLELEVG